MAWEPLGALKDIPDCPKVAGHSRTSPIVLRQLPGMEALRALKAIPDCPKAVARNGNP